VIAFLRFQFIFWTFFILPAQGFVNALIYFHSRTKNRRSRTTEQSSRSSSFFAPSFRRWESFWCSFWKRRSTPSVDPLVVVVVRVTKEAELQDLENADPLAPVVARVTQEEEPQDPQNKDPGVMEQIDRNGATEGSQKLSDPVGMDLSTTPEASLEY
jgi:hypothetical protein